MDLNSAAMDPICKGKIVILFFFFAITSAPLVLNNQHHLFVNNSTVQLQKRTCNNVWQQLLLFNATEKIIEKARCISFLVDEAVSITSFGSSTSTVNEMHYARLLSAIANEVADGMSGDARWASGVAVAVIDDLVDIDVGLAKTLFQQKNSNSRAFNYNRAKGACGDDT